MSLAHSLLNLSSYIISRLVCNNVCDLVLVVLQHLNQAHNCQRMQSLQNNTILVYIRLHLLGLVTVRGSWRSIVQGTVQSNSCFELF